MMRGRFRLGMLTAIAAISATAPAFGAGDPAKGAELHRACLGCHGTELYVPPLAKITTSSALKKEIAKWNDRMNPKFTRQELENLLAYLERDFYRFSK